MIDSKKLDLLLVPLSKKVIDETVALKSEVFKDTTHPSKIYNMVLKEKLLNEEYVVFEAKYNDELVGGAFVTYIVLDGEPILILEYIFVKDEYQNKGIGTRLLKYIFDNIPILNKMFDQEFKKWMLNPFNIDKEFYEKLGFSYSDSVYMTKNI